MTLSEIITWKPWREIEHLDRALTKVIAWNPCDGAHDLFLPMLGPLEMIALEDNWTHFAIVSGPRIAAREANQ